MQANSNINNSKDKSNSNFYKTKQSKNAFINTNEYFYNTYNSRFSLPLIKVILENLILCFY